MLGRSTNVAGSVWCGEVVASVPKVVEKGIGISYPIRKAK